MIGAETDALCTAVGANIRNIRGSAQVEHVSYEDWASVTFKGARHRLRISFEGVGAAGAAADFLALMPDLDLPLAGQIVADLALLADGRSDDGRSAFLELEALTIEDG